MTAVPRCAQNQPFLTMLTITLAKIGITMGSHLSFGIFPCALAFLYWKFVPVVIVPLSFLFWLKWIVIFNASFWRSHNPPKSTSNTHTPGSWQASKVKSQNLKKFKFPETVFIDILTKWRWIKDFLHQFKGIFMHFKIWYWKQKSTHILQQGGLMNVGHVVRERGHFARTWSKMPIMAYL